MIPSRRYLALAGIAGLALIGVLAGAASSEDNAPSVKPAAKELDRGKRLLVEPSITSVVKNASAPAPQQPQPAFRAAGGFPMQPNQQLFAAQPGRPLDMSKNKRIEPRIEEFVKAAAALKQAQLAKEEFVNPKVAPGKVRWHASFAEAQAAALKSKKPVMIFQMMGKLDDQFC